MASPVNVGVRRFVFPGRTFRKLWWSGVSFRILMILRSFQKLILISKPRLLLLFIVKFSLGRRMTLRLLIFMLRFMGCRPPRTLLLVRVSVWHLQMSGVQTRRFLVFRRVIRLCLARFLLVPVLRYGRFMKLSFRLSLILIPVFTVKMLLKILFFLCC